MFAPLRQRDFSLLWFAGLVSVAGDFALMIALPLHAYALTGSAVATGGVFAAGLVPRVILGSVAGVFVDRWDRKRTMVTADLLRALLLLPLLLVDSPDLLWLLYASRAAVGTLGLFFGPAETALLPKLVGKERLVQANALNALNNNLGRLVGPALGGVAYAAFGLPGAVLVDAATFLGSALLVGLIRADARPERRDPATAAGTAWKRMADEWVAGLRLVRGSRVLWAAFGAFGLGMVGEGTFEVGFTPLVVDVLAGGAPGAGWLMSAQAIGGLAAGAIVAAVASRVPPRRLFGFGLAGIGLCDLAMANTTTLTDPGPVAIGVASVFMLLAGFPAVAFQAAGTSLIQEATADAFRGRVFGALGAVDGIAILVGIGLGGPAIDRFGVVPVLSVGAAMWIVGGAFAMAALPRTGNRATTRPETGRPDRREAAAGGESANSDAPPEAADAWRARQKTDTAVLDETGVTSR